MKISTFLQSRMDTLVRIGNVYTFADCLPEYLKIFGAPGLFHTEAARPYHLSKSGSVSLVKFNERYFALATYHQFFKHEYGFDQLCIANPTRGTLLSPQHVIFPNGKAEQREDYDCVLLEYTDPVLRGLLPREIWFDLALVDKEEPKSDPIALLCIGFPGCRNNIDYESGTYAVAPNCVLGTPEGQGVSGRKSFSPASPVSYDPSGMSGAPVFRMDISGDDLRLNFSGILTEATPHRFNYFPMTRIMKDYFSRIN